MWQVSQRWAPTNHLVTAAAPSFPIVAEGSIHRDFVVALSPGLCLSSALAVSMRRLSFILALVLIAALVVIELYDFFVTNEGVRYFASQPQRWLGIMLLGIGAGAVPLAISRLSPDSQRNRYG